MRRSSTRSLVLIAAMVALLIGPVTLPVRAQAGTPAAAARYTVTDLGTLGGVAAFTQEVNARGQIVANVDFQGDSGATPVADAPTPHRAVLWENGATTDLGTLGGFISDAIDLNDAGQVVGMSTLADGKQRAFLWQNGTMTDLGTLGGPHSEAIRINERGQVVGLSTTEPGQEQGDPGTHAFLWTDGEMIDLGTFGGAFSRSNGINDAGQVVGAAETAEGHIHAFRWDNGTMTDLGTVPGYNDSRALRITNNGLMTGFAAAPVEEQADGAGVPALSALFFKDGQIIELGTLPGYEAASIGFGLNTAGQVVGRSEATAESEDAPPPSHGFLWENGVMTDLNDLIPPDGGVEITGAGGIEEDGRIGAIATVDGVAHAILLTPTN